MFDLATKLPERSRRLRWVMCVYQGQVFFFFKNCPLHRKKKSQQNALTAGLFSPNFQFIHCWWGVETSETSAHGVTFQKAVIATAVIASNLTTKSLAGRTRLCAVSSDCKTRALYRAQRLEWDKQFIQLCYVEGWIYWQTRAFIHFAVCLTAGPQPLPKRVLHRVRAIASSSIFQYPLFSLRSSSSC